MRNFLALGLRPEGQVPGIVTRHLVLKARALGDGGP